MQTSMVVRRPVIASPLGLASEISDTHNSIPKRTMKTRAQSLAVLVLTLAGLSAPPSRARADVFADWMRTSDAHMGANSTFDIQAFGKITMTRVAMFDAINAVVGGYTPYALNVVAPGASVDAAIAQAAYTVCTNAGPTGLSTLNSALATSLANIPAGPAKEAGIQIGRLAGEAIIRLRSGDAPGLNVPDVQGTAPGQWRRTPPNFLSGGFTWERYLPPWTTRSSSQFRPPPPPALTSALYAADYNEVRVLGSSTNPDRTPEQAENAQLHERGENYDADVLAQHPLPLLDAARREALRWMVYMDAFSHLSDGLWAYRFWRPITAIQEGDNDGNDATPGDPTWTPFINSHRYPDYPSGRLAQLVIDIDILILLHGDDFSFTVRSPGKARTFARLSDYAQSSIEARIIGGTHFRNSCNATAEMTRQIARHAFQNYLRPVPRLRTGPVQPGEFTLFVEQPSFTAFRVETSSDLQQWQPWQSSLLGVLSLMDTNTTADRQFYRLNLGQP
jgi:hypothetical protein